MKSNVKSLKQKSSDVPAFNPQEIEPKWQKKWEEEKVYSPNLEKSQKPFYNLMMFPYPSAEGLHVGSFFTYGGIDAYGRFMRMQGNDVFEPIGLDGFGIHSENYAIKVGRSPKEHAAISEKNFYRQLHSLGNGFDWTRTLETYDPAYYKWTQWLFIQLFKKGLAYRKKAPVNFCPSCKTVLSDEQVIDGKCERCGTLVEKRNLEQWFFEITKYSDRLLNNLKDLDWTEKVKIAQKNWIGKKEGIGITYDIVIPTEVEGSKYVERDSSTPEFSSVARNDKLTVTVFTTRPDTNFGATFIALAPENPLVEKILKQVQDDKIKQEVREYVKTAGKKSDIERQTEGKEKTGAFTGAFAINHLTGFAMPIWVSDFVLMGFGTGALVGVPGHDMRDFEFATKFGLEIVRVVVGKDGDTTAITKSAQVQEEEGTMINSDFLNGLDIHIATQKIMDHIEEKGWGKRVATYHLRDWLISRQRYWGPPIPMIHCEKDGWVPVPEDQLPVLLPDLENWKPTGTGEAPLAQLTDWVKTTCPVCGGHAKRETDVSDTFLDSAWYFFRYISTDCEDIPFSKDRGRRWLPVNSYIGGAEHSVLHLLYSRFVTMVLKDMGYIDFEEPFARFRANGLIIKDGAKMSKSKGNVVIPDEYIAKFGADTLRSYLAFLGPFTQGGDFSDSGIEGMHKFLRRVWVLVQKVDTSKIQTKEHRSMMHKTIKKVTQEIPELRFNTAIAALMEWYNFLSQEESITKEEAEVFIKMLAPFAPHMTEELWQSLTVDSRGPAAHHPHSTSSQAAGAQRGTPSRITPEFVSIHQQSWPVFDSKYLVEETVVIAVQVNGKLRDTLSVAADVLEKDVVEMAKASEKTAKFLEGKKVVKIIYVAGKIVNFVVA